MALKQFKLTLPARKNARGEDMFTRQVVIAYSDRQDLEPGIFMFTKDDFGQIDKDEVISALVRLVDKGEDI